MHLLYSKYMPLSTREFRLSACAEHTNGDRDGRVYGRDVNGIVDVVVDVDVDMAKSTRRADRPTVCVYISLTCMSDDKQLTSDTLQRQPRRRRRRRFLSRVLRRGRCCCCCCCSRLCTVEHN